MNYVTPLSCLLFEILKECTSFLNLLAVFDTQQPSLLSYHCVDPQWEIDIAVLTVQQKLGMLHTCLFILAIVKHQS